MRPTNTDDFVHTGPGTLAGRYMRMFWQPVYRAKDLLVGWAKPIRIMSEDMTLYRGHSGRPYLVASRCAHRGTQLSVGQVEEECIRCFYHGWKYDGTGQCVEQPAEPRPFAERVKIRSYPVQESMGLIFAYMGEGEPPPLPRYPQFDLREGFYYLEANYRNCNFFQNVENSFDPVHVGFVHRGMPGSHDGRTNNPIISVEETEWGFRACYEYPSGAKRFAYCGMPNVQLVPSSFSDYDIISNRDFVSWKLPVDDEHNLQFLLIALNADAESARRYIERRLKAVAAGTVDHRELAKKVLAGELRLEDVDPETTEVLALQDDLSQCGQGVVADRSTETLGKSDAALIMMRRLWSQELRALAQGQPIKQWKFRPDQIAAGQYLAAVT